MDTYIKAFLDADAIAQLEMGQSDVEPDSYIDETGTLRFRAKRYGGHERSHVNIALTAIAEVIRNRSSSSP